MSSSEQVGKGVLLLLFLAIGQTDPPKKGSSVKFYDNDIRYRLPF